MSSVLPVPEPLVPMEELYLGVLTADCPSLTPAHSARLLRSCLYARGAGESVGIECASASELLCVGLTVLEQLLCRLTERRGGPDFHLFAEETWGLLRADVMGALLLQLQSEDLLVSHLSAMCASAAVIQQLHNTGLLDSEWSQWSVQTLLCSPGPPLDACVRCLTEVLRRLLKGAHYELSEKVLVELDSSLSTSCPLWLSADSGWGSSVVLVVDLLEVLCACRSSCRQPTALRGQCLLGVCSRELLTLCFCSEAMVRRRVLLLLKRALVHRVGEDWSGGQQGPSCGALGLLAHAVLRAAAQGELKAVPLEGATFFGGSLTSSGSVDTVSLRALCLVLLKSMELQCGSNVSVYDLEQVPLALCLQSLLDIVSGTSSGISSGTSSGSSSGISSGSSSVSSSVSSSRISPGISSGSSSRISSGTSSVSSSGTSSGSSSVSSSVSSSRISPGISSGSSSRISSGTSSVSSSGTSSGSSSVSSSVSSSRISPGISSGSSSRISSGTSSVSSSRISSGSSSGSSSGISSGPSSGPSSWTSSGTSSGPSSGPSSGSSSWTSSGISSGPSSGISSGPSSGPSSGSSSWTSSGTSSGTSAGLPHRCSVLSSVFVEQDDDMMEANKALLCVFLHCRRQEQARSAPLPLWACPLGLNPHCHFLLLLRSLAFDHRVLLDFLISTETCFLEYCVRYLRFLRSDPRGFCAACASVPLEQGPGRDRAEQDPGRDRAEQGPRRDRAEQDPGRDRAEQGPRRDGAEQGPGRDGAEQGPGRDGAEQGPGRDGAEQGPGRDGAEQGPGRDRAEQGPGRDRAEQGPGRDRAEQGPGRDGAEQGPGRDGAEQGPGRDGAEQGPGRDGAEQGPSGVFLVDYSSSDESDTEEMERTAHCGRAELSGSCLETAVRCLCQLHEIVSRLHRKKLFPYNPSSLIKLLAEAEASLKSECVK